MTQDFIERLPLEMIRGDTFYLGVQFIGLDTDIEASRFSIKKSKEDITPLVEKTLGNGISKVEDGVYRVRVAPSDTASFEGGVYQYDWEFSVNDDVFTAVIGSLDIQADISR